MAQSKKSGATKIPNIMNDKIGRLLVLLLIPCVFALQENEFLRMKALGRPAHLGFLYDARLERFLDFSVFKKALPDTFVKTHQTPFLSVKTSLTNTYQEKFNLFDISASLSASVLSGMLTIKGSAQFLKSNQKHSKEVTGALLLDCKTVTESLELYYTDLQDLFNTELIANTEATHVVTGISWGANVVVIFKDTVTDEKDETKITGSLELEFKNLKGPFQISKSAAVDISAKESNETSTFAISILGDILLPDKIPATNEEVKQLIKNVPAIINSTSGGKGVPVEFTLTPIGLLNSHLRSTSEKNNFVAKIEETILHDFVTVFDSILSVEKLVNDYYELFRQNQVCVLRDTLTKISRLRTNFLKAKIFFTTAFQTALVKVRSSQADSTVLSELIISYENEEFGATNVKDLVGDFNAAQEKVELYKVFVKSNAIRYFGATNSLKAELAANGHSILYILFLKSEWMNKDSVAWENTIHTFLHVLNIPANKLFVVDCDFEISECNSLRRTTIMQRALGKTILKDVNTVIKMTEDNVGLTLKGLGTNAQIGELYDARTDTFFEVSILKSSHSQSLIQSSTQNITQTVSVPSEAIQDKFAAFQIQEEQQLSILAGSLPRFRSGNYLATSTQTKSKQVYRQSILQTTRTFEAQLDTELPVFTNEIAQENLFSNIATHFVTKVEHGYNTVFFFEATCSNNHPQAEDSVRFNTNHCNAKLQKLKASFFQLFSKITLSKEQNLNLKDELNFLENATMNFKIVVYSDTQLLNSPPMTFDAADSFYDFLTTDFVPNYKDKNAPAITYYLTPISSLQKKGIIAPVVSYGSLSSNVFTPSDVISVLEDIEEAREQILQVLQKLQKNSYCITDQDFSLLKKIKNRFESSLGNFQKKYRNKVLKIKRGTLSNNSLEKLICRYKNFDLFDNSKSFKRLKRLTRAEKKVQFCQQFDDTNVKYLGRENVSLYFDAIFEPKQAKMSLVYLMYFKSGWLSKNSSVKTDWQSTSQKFVGQLSTRVRINPAVYYVIDCDFQHTNCANITRPSIFEYKNGVLTTTDYEEAFEEEEETLQGQLDKLRASVTDNLASVKTEVTKIKSDLIEHTDGVSAKLEAEVTRNRNDIGAQQTGLDSVNRTAIQNQENIRVAARFICKAQKPAFIAKATTSSSFGCGGTIQLPSKGESIVLDFNLSATNGPLQRCLWTLHATQNDTLVRFQVKLTVLCQHPPQILDENTLTFSERHSHGETTTSREITTNRIGSSPQNSFLRSNQYIYQGFLSFNSKRIDSEAGFILRFDVLDTHVYSWASSSSSTQTESVGSASYSLRSSDDLSSIVINPMPVVKMTLTVDVDSSGLSNFCLSWDSVIVLEFGMDGVPRTLERLCGRTSVTSYETENPVAVLFFWSPGKSGRGVKLSWK